MARRLIQSGEGHNLSVPTDVGDHTITIGYGYTLFLRDGRGGWVMRDQAQLTADLGAIGIVLSAAQLNQLRSIEIELNRPNNLPAVSAGIAAFAASWVTPLSNDQAETLFSRSLSDVKAAIRNRFRVRLGSNAAGDALFNDLQGTREMAGLLSVGYNGAALIGGRLISALASGNRAEAWYELRYGSNGGANQLVRAGLAKRHFAEAQYIGLFHDPANPGADEARDAYRMLTSHRNDILEYEATFGAPPDGSVASNGNRIATANADFRNELVLAGVGNIPTLVEALNPARDALVAWLNPQLPAAHQLTASQWNSAAVYVASVAGSPSPASLDARPDDGKAQGMENNLMVGSSASDWMIGGAGNDVLFGDGGGDLLVGGAGTDILYGGAGIDDQDGGADDDQFIDTAGDDIYRFNGVFGDDVIDDKDGTGRVRVDGITITGADARQVDEFLWRAENRRVEYVLVPTVSGQDLQLRFAGSDDTVLIKDWSNGELGITLAGPRIAHAVRDLFDQAAGVSRPASPITLDLDGDGFETVGNGVDRTDGWGTPIPGTGSGRGVYFDHDADGIKTLSGWVDRDDGLLVWDRDGNGRIDTGRELFGSNTLLGNGTQAGDGFIALRDIDGNQDGRITVDDAAFGSLGVWQDLNQNGISDAGEISRLADLHITQISTAETQYSEVPANGNRFQGLGSFVRDGQTRQLTDVWFINDGFQRQFTDAVPVSDVIKALPGIEGSGAVRDLREAAMQSAELAALMQQFKAANTATAQRALIDSLLETWAATSSLVTTAEKAAAGATVTYEFGTIAAGSAEEALWKKRLSVLEAFTGRTYPLTAVSGVAGVRIYVASVALLAQSYGALQQSVYAGLVLQTRLQPLFDLVPVRSVGAGTGQTDFSQLTQELNRRIAADPINGIADLIDFNRAAGPGLLGAGWDGWTILQTALANAPATAALQNMLAQWGVQVAGTQYALLSGGALNDVLIGGATRDQLHGEGGDDVLLGGAGDDVMSGNGGNDVLDGGAGSDTLIGDMGSDTYLFGRGSGQDSIVLVGAGEALAGDEDIIQLAPGISSADLLMTKPGAALVIGIRGTADTLTIVEYFAHDANPGSSPSVRIRLADGTLLDPSVIRAAVLAGSAESETITGFDGDDRIVGGAGNDTANGGSGSDLLSGDDGNDTLNGNGGSDRVQGGAGADLLYGENGEDTLDGGAGSDTLVGGNGADTYLFGRGAGQDTIFNDDFDAPGTQADSVQFGEGISRGDIAFSRSGIYGTGNDLIVTIKDTGETLTLLGYLRDDGATVAAVDFFNFEDGASLDISGIKASLITATEGNDRLVGYGSDDVIHAAAGDDAVSGQAGNDVLDGGAGRDDMSGGAGNDTLDGGLGADTLYGDDGADTYVFGRGSGQDTIRNIDTDTLGVNADTLLFAEGLVRSDVSFGRLGNDLVLRINGTDDSVTVVDYFKNDATTTAVIENIRFADGTNLNPATVKAAVLLGTEGDDVLIGGAADDVLNGGAGNDTLSGEGGSDVLDGGAGNDVLRGASVFTLSSGADTYLFGRGSGNDTIYNYDSDALGVNADSIQFGAGITAADIKVSREDTNLRLRIRDTGDSLLVQNYFLEDIATPYAVELIRFADGVTWGLADIRAAVLMGSEGAETITGYATGDTIRAGAGDDVLSGLAGNDDLHGDGGSDTLDGGDGNDVLDGGTGNDSLSGGAGADIYLFGRGAGQDVVNNIDTDLLGVSADTVQLAPDIQVADLVVRRIGDDLVLEINGTGDSMKVLNYFVSDATTKSAVEYIRFADGTAWDVAAVKLRALNGSGRDDVLVGYASDDILSGGAGSDTLYGGAGNDVLDGGPGNDILYGQDGADVYLFGRGSGQDMIDNWDRDSIGTQTDIIQLGQGVGVGDVIVRRVGYDLLIAISGTSDTLKVAAYFMPVLNSVYPVDGIRFADGTQWDFTTVSARALLGSPGDDIIEGTSAVDIIHAGAGNDTVSGDTGDDLLYGDDGSDTLRGDDGKDTLDGGSGVDTLLGGAGDDVYMVDNAGDTVTESSGGGVDLVQSAVTYVLGANVENLTLIGGAAIDGTGNSLNNLLTGNGAANVLDGGSGSDTMTGGAGDDTYKVNVATDTVIELAGEGVDTVSAAISYTLGANVENLLLTGNAAINGTGNALDNSLTGNSANNTLTGGAGNDVLDGGAGNDTMVGGIGNDTYVVNISSDVVTESANEGTDLVRSSVTLTLGANIENLTLMGTTAINGTGNTLNNVMVGNSANNTLDGSTGADTLAGGAGDDTYIVDDTTDLITENANEGTDLVQSSVTYSLAANVENLTLTNTSAISGTGNALDNSLTGNSANNTLMGGAGNDMLNGGAGTDTMVGGVGNDTYVIDVTTDVVTEAANEGIDLVQSAVTLTLGANVENLLLTGTTAINGTGNALDNSLTGNSANNTLTGGAGNDTLNGGAGTDTMVGGAGNDTYVIDVTTDVVTEAANEGIDLVQSAVTLTLGANVENLLLTGTTAINGTGNTLDNSLTGNGANNTLSGLDGNDTYDGGAGTDALTDTSTTSADIYRFGIGYGTDTITDSGGTDRVELGAGVTQSQLVFTRNGNNLELTFTGQTDKLIVANWYTVTANRIEQFRLADGTVVSPGLIPASAQASVAVAATVTAIGVAAQDQPAADAWFRDWRHGGEFPVQPAVAILPAISGLPPSLDQQVQALVSAMAAFGVPAGSSDPFSPMAERSYPQWAVAAM